MLKSKNVTTDQQLYKAVKSLKIPHFRGIFSRNNLPRGGPHLFETAIINLDNKKGKGTHWVAYVKKFSNVNYFDSFGNLRPPIEIIKYFGPKVNIFYNYEKHQSWNEKNCGQLCLRFLRDKTHG